MGHTSGPWDFDGCTDDGRVSCGGAPAYYQIDAPTPEGLNAKLPYTVCDTVNRHHCISPEEDLANARLISAAPELLNALRWSIKHDGECLGDHPEILEAAKVLLAKIEANS